MEILESSIERPFPELDAWMADTETNQAELAAVLGVSEPFVSLFLSGKRGLSTESSVKLSLLTGIPVEKLCKDATATRLLKLLGKRENRSHRKSKRKSNVA